MVRGWVIHASAHCYQLGMFVYHIVSFFSKCQDDAETWQVEQGWNSVAPRTVPEQRLLLQDRKRSHHARERRQNALHFNPHLAYQSLTGADSTAFCPPCSMGPNMHLNTTSAAFTFIFFLSSSKQNPRVAL